MPDFAIVALEDACQMSVAALVDSFALARDRVEQLFSGPDPLRIQTALRVVSHDQARVLMNNGEPLHGDRPFSDGATNIASSGCLHSAQAGSPN